MPLLDASDRSALLRAAAASLSGADAGAATHHTGSAAYLLASMLNHRCGWHGPLKGAGQAASPPSTAHCLQTKCATRACSLQRGVSCLRSVLHLVPNSGRLAHASLTPRSCEPNLDVTFPGNNAIVSFVAARDISAREQLTISYVDTGMGLQQRRSALRFGYGFTCGCPRCTEEAAAEAGGGGGGQRHT